VTGAGRGLLERLVLRALVLAGLALVAVPLAWPARGLLQRAAWPDADMLVRVGLLARNTALLVLLVELIAVPAGIVLAVLLYRTDLPGRGLWTVLVLLSLFVPLPLVTSGWQAVLGSGGFYPMQAWGAAVGGWAPWAEGIGPAAWAHAVAGLPWVVLLVGHGLARVERNLEEDALLLRGPAGVLWHVTLPRCAGSIAAAMLWLAVQAGTEITVTDIMQVRTFAEEVYTQFVAPEPGLGPGDPLARAEAASLVSVLPFVLAVVLLARQVARALPSGPVAYRRAVQVPLGPAGWPAAILVAVLAGGLLAVPLAGLVWRAGLAGMPPAWSLGVLLRQLGATLASDAGLIGRALAVAAVSAGLCAALALAACWLARGRRVAAALLLVLLALAWVMPGPVVGLGLKGVFGTILDLAASVESRPDVRGRWLARLLWDGPSVLPLVWVYLVRFLPFAAAVLWPRVRLVPAELVEAARLDGAGPVGELAWVAAPALWRTWLVAAAAVAVLTLGELAGGKMVSTPGAESYAEALFSQMHYGIGPDLAARCLWLLLAAALGAGLVGWLASRNVRR
jgi:iron(III) transport system permease protein